jgi:hypothetical protein
MSASADQRRRSSRVKTATDQDETAINISDPRHKFHKDSSKDELHSGSTLFAHMMAQLRGSVAANSTERPVTSRKMDIKKTLKVVV